MSHLRLPTINQAAWILVTFSLILVIPRAMFPDLKIILGFLSDLTMGLGIYGWAYVHGARRNETSN